MVKNAKSIKDNQQVTRKEFSERFDKVDERFDKVDKRLDKVDSALQNQAKAIIKNSEDIEVIKETMATKDDIQKVLTAIDSFAQKSQDVERKSIVNTHRINEIETKLEEHTKRIGRLESAHH